MTDVKEKQIWKEPAFVVGIVLTVLVLGGFAYTLFLWPMNDTYATKWAYLRNAQPNEIGDTLAGVAGTLAFVWIVVTVWLQATDLREQRQEFRRMSIAQEAQAAVLEKQREIFQDEQRQRDELQALALFEEVCREVLEIADELAGLSWFHAEDKQSVSSITLTVRRGRNAPWHEKLKAVCSAYYAVDKLEWRCREGQLIPDVSRPPEIQELRRTIETLECLIPRLPEAQRFQMRRVDLKQLSSHVSLLENSDVF